MNVRAGRSGEMSAPVSNAEPVVRIRLAWQVIAMHYYAGTRRYDAMKHRANTHKRPATLLWIIVAVCVVISVSTVQYSRRSSVDEGSQPTRVRSFEPLATTKPLQHDRQTSLDYKRSLCEKDMERSRAALSLVRITGDKSRRKHQPTRYPRVLCFVNTISVHHSSRAQAVADTWGQRCDKLLFFSNVSDTLYVGRGTPLERKFEVVFIDVIADHDHLWQKHKASLQYVYDNYRHDFDWFYKADDDAYVIVDNLRDYLMRPEILMNYKRQPMQMGHRFNLTAQLVDYYVVDRKVKYYWNQRFDRWVFNSGGPGYAMNRLYLDKVVPLFSNWNCLSDEMSEMLPDDASISYCMMWHGVFPWDTRDTSGRERWHADNPKGAYHAYYEDPEYWYNQYHRQIGGVRTGEDCCAPDSVAFHYIKPRVMYQIERELYFCRAGDDVADVTEFNKRHQLAIGEKVMVWEPKPPKKQN